MLPLSITLIRHGESESNLAKKRFERSMALAREGELMEAHTSERRLTPRGKAQAQAAGDWLRVNLWDPERPKFFRFYVSSYVRAMETAGHINVGENWHVDARLMERNWGSLDQLPYTERVKQFERELKRRKDYAYFWRPSDGETLQDVFTRSRDMLGTLHRECSDKHVVLVTHGETMWVWRTMLERWLPAQLRENMVHHSSQTRISNCRIIQYTRLGEDGTESPRLVRMRMVDPTAPSDPERNLGWTPVHRVLWSPKDLRQYADNYPCFITPEDEAA